MRAFAQLRSTQKNIFKKFKNRTLNKKHKGVRRETKEMNLKVTLKE